MLLLTHYAKLGEEVLNSEQRSSKEEIETNAEGISSDNAHDSFDETDVSLSARALDVHMAIKLRENGLNELAILSENPLF